jgi:carboxymethylenebutenolidase
VAVGAVWFALDTASHLNDARQVTWRAYAPAPGEPGPKERTADGVRSSMGQYQSKGRQIRIERYLPAAKGRYPAVLLIHGGGADGAPALRGMARDYVRRGYAALVPRYFDQTDTAFADIPTIDRNFVAWMGAVSGAIEHARGLPDVDPDRVGLIGWSLGSSLALEVSATNPHPAAVVGVVGGMAKEITDKMKRMPPTLLLDGGSDPNYPAHLARQLYRTLKKKGVAVESKVYPGQGHGFTGEAAADAARRIEAFFDKHLAGRAPEGAGQSPSP